MMPPQDYEVCHQLVTKLSSRHYSNSNYLFLDPVDTAYFPTYNSIITRPMDLGTLQRLLEGGSTYNSREEFFSDLMLTFQNAIHFHSDIKENSWIVKLAKEMIKISNKEYKAALQKRKHSTMDPSSSAMEITSHTATTAASTSNKSKKRKRSVTTTEEIATAADPIAATAVVVLDGVTTTHKKKKKSSSSSTHLTPPIVASAATAEVPISNSTTTPPVSLKVAKTSSKSKKEKANTTSTTSTKDGVGEKDKKSSSSVSSIKPKIKLRLSLNKSKSEDTQQPSTDEVSPIITKKASDSKKKTSSKSKSGTSGSSIAGSVSSANPSRGKELPKTVVATQHKQKQASKSTSSTSQAPKQPAAGSRGKELPKSIASQQQQTAVRQTTSPAAGIAAYTKAPTASAITPLGADLPLGQTTMTEARKVQCWKFISALKRRQHRNVAWFVKPVNDPRIIEDYIAKIPHPMDLGTATAKLESGQYATVPEFVRDIRRIFGNCLRYNTTAGDTFRPVAVEMAREAESLLALFLHQYNSTSILYPPLLYCWQVCVGSLDVLLAMKNPEDDLPTAHFFLHPASFFFGGEFPPDYLLKVPMPMDLGTITSNLMEGVYQSVSKFVADCSLVCQNCYKYNSDKTDGAALVAHAQRLQSQMEQQLGALIRYDQTEGNRLGASVQPASIPKPPPQFLLGILQELRENIYTDRFTKLSERAAEPFEKPVDISLFPDYLDYVQRPMCLEMIQKNIEMNMYETPEDFEYDVQQIFKNCENYNLPKKNEHIIAVSKHLSKVFRKLYHSRTKNFEENALAGNLGVTTLTSTAISGALDVVATKIKMSAEEKRPSSPAYSITSQVSVAASQGGEKKLKVAKVSKRSISRVPSLNNITNESSPKVRISTSKLGAVKKGGKKSSQTGDTVASSAADLAPRPITLDEAISRIHSQYERRSVKDLDSWESACHRLYRELLRHPWLSGANPKFIYHAPITSIFPEIADAYCAKIEKPMDLSTIESKLLCGSLYTCPQDFVNDIALVFSNAITFNKLGRDEGVATSCAYYDASSHLLRFSRWLSLDILSNFLFDDSEIGAAPKDGSYSDWKLTTSYKYAAKAEMENIALKHHMEKSDIGDRYTWMEAEAEKLLKSLRHQSDLRYMTYFISPQYPADYAAFISKPMAWEVVQLNLQQRKYDTLGEVVEDLRLIFSNALKYNARAKGTDTVSGRAYDAAVYMKIKLEVAIHKLLVATSDRIEREKIEEAVGEREAEAAERSAAMRKREDQIRLQAEWEREQALLMKNNQSNITEKVEKKQQLVETARVIIKPKLTVKRPTLHFDFEVNEDDIDNTSKREQTQLEDMRLQKALFEKQKNERKISVKASKIVSASLFFKLADRANTREFEVTMPKQQQRLQKMSVRSDAVDDDKSHYYADANKSEYHEPADAISSVIPRTTNILPSRENPIKIALLVDNKKGKSRKAQLYSSRITFLDDN